MYNSEYLMFGIIIYLSTKKISNCSINLISKYMET
jgi:hypothetical protein